MGFALIIVHSKRLIALSRYVVCGVLIEFYKWRRTTVSKQSCHATMTRNGASHTAIVCRVSLLH